MNTSNPRGNRAHVERDAEAIVRRLREGASLASLMREYRCAYPTIMRVIRARIDEGEQRTIRRRNQSRGGRATRFKRGHVPWIKGLKGIRMSPATEFKPGGLRGKAARNWRPIGTITTRRDHKQRRAFGRPKLSHLRRFIKVRDDGPMWERWVRLAIWRWQQSHGRIPGGHCLVHLDGDTMNDDLDNLRVIPRSELPAFQRAIDPEIETRMKKGLRAGARKRSTARKGMQAHRRIARSRLGTLWECPGCGYTPDTPPDGQSCPKCCGGVFAEIRVRVPA